MVDQSDWAAIANEVDKIEIEDIEPTYRIAMLGTSGVGKTVFMTTMLHDLINGRRLLKVQAEASIINEINGNYERLCNNQMPPGTGVKRDWHFSVHAKGKKLFEFDWIDYRGGALSNTEIQAQSPETGELFDYLKGSLAVLVLADGWSFLKNSRHVKSEIANIKALIASSLQREPRPMHILLLLTKSDAVASKRIFGVLPYWDNNKLLRVCTQVFHQFSGLVRDYKDILCEVIPISSFGKSGIIDNNGVIRIKPETKKLQSFQVGIPMDRIFNTILIDVQSRIPVLEKMMRSSGVKNNEEYIEKSLDHFMVKINPLSHITTTGKKRLAEAIERKNHWKQQRDYCLALANHLRKIEEQAQYVIDHKRGQKFIGMTY